jgi:hypothetical protein
VKCCTHIAYVCPAVILSLIFCPYVIVYNSLSPSVIVCLTVRHFVIVFLIVCPSFVVCLRVSNDIWTEDQTENDSRTDIGNVTDEDDTPTDKDGDSYNSLILTCEFFCLFRVCKIVNKIQFLDTSTK